MQEEIEKLKQRIANLEAKEFKVLKSWYVKLSLIECIKDILEDKDFIEQERIKIIKFLICMEDDTTAEDAEIVSDIAPEHLSSLNDSKILRKRTLLIYKGFLKLLKDKSTKNNISDIRV